MLYNENETMKMLGEQNILELFENKEFENKFREVLEAHAKNTIPLENVIFEIGLDFMSLGIIIGKRLERERHKEKKGGKWVV